MNVSTKSDVTIAGYIDSQSSSHVSALKNNVDPERFAIVIRTKINTRKSFDTAKVLYDAINVGVKKSAYLETRSISTKTNQVVDAMYNASNEFENKILIGKYTNTIGMATAIFISKTKRIITIPVSANSQNSCLLSFLSSLSLFYL